MRKALLALVAGAMLAAPAALAQQRGTGLLYLEPERYRSIPLAPPVALTGVPAEFDMSKDFPTPGDQGQQGSCVGWAVGYALKSFQERRERNWTNWDDTKRMSPAFVYNQVKVGGCGDGARIADALGLLSSDGAAAWTDQPYRLEDCDQLPSALTKQNAAMNRIAGWFRVNPQDITVVKAHLAAGMPIIIGMGVDQSFKELEGDEAWAGNPGSRADGHAMVIVGYSDKRNAVKVINSWGTGWADKGFGWIDYEAFRRAVREAYVAQDVVLPIGVAERRSNPFLRDTGPFGPTIFGVQLGMSRSQMEHSITRPIRATSTGQSGFSKSTITAQVGGLQTLGAATFEIDDRYDYLHGMRLTFSNTLPSISNHSLIVLELEKSTSAISDAMARAATLEGRRWQLPDGFHFVIPQLPNVELGSVVSGLSDLGPEIVDAFDLLGLNDWKQRLGDSRSNAMESGPLRAPRPGYFEYNFPPVRIAKGDYDVSISGFLIGDITRATSTLDDWKAGRCPSCNPARLFDPSSVEATIMVDIQAARKTANTLQ